MHEKGRAPWHFTSSSPYAPTLTSIIHRSTPHQAGSIFQTVSLAHFSNILTDPQLSRYRAHIKLAASFKQTFWPPKILANSQFTEHNTDHNLKLIHHTIPRAGCSQEQVWHGHSRKPGPHSQLQHFLLIFSWWLLHCWLRALIFKCLPTCKTL